jgi:glycosyltransferase involved in cell wall biosynthesis
LISKNGLNQQVIIVGQVNPSNMDSYYNAADFLVHPSIIESFSMVCLEIMSAGKPFICTSNIGLVEYITPNEEAFVISPDNVDALTEKMEVLLKDTKLRQMMGEKSKLTAQKFLWSNQINKTISVYEQLIKS